MTQLEGEVIQIIGPVVDISFEHAGSELPSIHDALEVKKVLLKFPIAPEQVDAYNPAFDVTPHNLITAIITEKGVVMKPDRPRIARLFDA